MVIQVAGFSVSDLSWSDVGKRRDVGRQLVRVWEDMINAYNKSCDDEGVHTDEPMPKKRRRGRASKQPAANSSDTMPAGDEFAEVRVGTTRQTSIRMILQFSTSTSFASLEQHLSLIGGAPRSAISDSMLGCKSLWPLSQPAEGFYPSAAEEATRAAGKKAQVLPKKLTCLPVDYTAVLTPDQHDKLIQKLISTFEEQTLDSWTDKSNAMTVDKVASLRPTTKTINEARFVIQMWGQAIEKAASTDLASNQFDTVSQAVLQSNATQHNGT